MRREEPGLPLDLPAHVWIDMGREMARAFRARTVNSSMAGALLHAGQALSSGTSVRVALRRRADHPRHRTLGIVFSGRVVRCEAGGFDVALEAISVRLAAGDDPMGARPRQSTRSG